MLTQLKPQSTLQSARSVTATRSFPRSNTVARAGTGRPQSSQPAPNPQISDYYERTFAFPDPVYDRVVISRPPQAGSCSLYQAMSQGQRRVGACVPNGDSAADLVEADTDRAAEEIARCFDGAYGDTDTCDEGGNGNSARLQLEDVPGFRFARTDARLISTADESSASVRLRPESRQPGQAPRMSDHLGAAIAFKSPPYRTFTPHAPAQEAESGLFSATARDGSNKVGAWEMSSPSTIAWYEANSIADAREMVRCFNGERGDTDTCDEGGNGNSGDLQVTNVPGQRNPRTQIRLSSSADDSSWTIRG